MRIRLDSPVSSECVDGLNVQRCVPVEGHSLVNVLPSSIHLLFLIFYLLCVRLLLGKLWNSLCFYGLLLFRVHGLVEVPQF